MGYNIPSDHGGGVPREEQVRQVERELRPKREVQRWTPTQQQKLEEATRMARELSEQKAKLHRDNLGPLQEFVTTLAQVDFDGDVKIVQDDGVDQLSEYLVKHAEKLRDLLEPFDQRWPS